MLQLVSSVLISSLVTAIILRFFSSRRRESASSTAVVAGTSAGLPFVAKQADEKERDGHIRFEFQRIPHSEARRRSDDLYRFLNTRRSVRFFSPDKVDEQTVVNCILAAGTAPSGAHQQPWVFLLVKSPDVKMKIREVVEREEQVNYEVRMKKTWVADVHPVVGDLHKDGVVKPYLSEAPYLIVCMKVTYGLDEENKKLEHYYVQQGCGIACGLLLAALHNANLCTLTSTPLGAEKDIAHILERPKNEKVFLLMPVGYPSHNATVPYRTAETWRKPREQILAIV